MSVDLTHSSIAQWFAEREQHRCGYCKNDTGSISYGMLTEDLTVEDYKDLIDRGWRRSGKYCYKPTMDKTCCPQYAIRCDTAEFILNKSHKKIIKKFNKFLANGIYSKNEILTDQQNEERGDEIPGYNKNSCINLNQVVTTAEGSSCKVACQQIEINIGEPDIHSVQNYDNKDVDNRIQNYEIADISRTPLYNSKKAKKHCKDGTGPDLNKPPCKKAKIVRLERKREKMLQKGQEFPQNIKTNNEQKNLIQFLEEIPLTAKHKLKLKLIPTSECGDEWEQVKDTEFEIYKKYQMIVHNDPPEKLSMRSFTRFLVTSPLKIVLERMDKEHRDFPVSAELFKKYQMNVHSDTPQRCDESEFYDFLVSTPLKPKKFPGDIDGPGYGSFHQQYWIDDKLIAVGVVDILPGCVSSVYFFYDPDFRDLTLGTYGSLREIELVQRLYTKIPDLRYYYMGFYIHSCPKMRYKGKLNPSDLLCPETYIWVPIEKCLRKLDASKYSRLNEDIDALDENACCVADINDIKVIYNFKLMYVKDYIRVFKGNRGDFKNLADLVGKKSAQNIIFWIV